MPRGDRTGPAGMGPMTGRGLGGCSVGEQAMAGNFVRGFGYGAGRGGRGYFGQGRGFRGRGWRNWFNATGLPGQARAGVGFAGPVGPTVTAEQELEGLKQQADFLQNSLSQISERIGQLEKESDK